MIARSAFAEEVTRFEVEALLFAAILSVDVVLMVEVMFSVVPAAVLALT